MISKPKKLIFTALMLALLVVLSRFLSLKTPIIKISFAFLPTMLCATWLGPKWTILLNFLGDLIGATLFPTGPFFIGYTLSTVLAGAIYGFFLHRKQPDSIPYKKYLLRVILAVVIVAVVVNLGLNTLWTSITAGKAFLPLLATRAYTQLISAPIHIAIFLAVEAILRRPLDKILRTPSNDEPSSEKPASNSSSADKSALNSAADHPTA